MTDTSAQIEAGAAAIRAALDLLDKPLELYRRAPDSARIRLNQTFFGGFYVDDAGDLTGTLNPPFDDLHDAARAFRVVQGGKDDGEGPKRRVRAPRTRQTTGSDVPSLADVFAVKGWNKREMVGHVRVLQRSQPLRGSDRERHSEARAGPRSNGRSPLDNDRDASRPCIVDRQPCTDGQAAARRTGWFSRVGRCRTG
jgi:hypothetical protein